jgi:Type I phosphodiesterase / nucleotide pyrophosphatase
MRGLLRPLADMGRFSPLGLGPARRLVLVQIDGVSRARIEHAMAEGYMPFLASRLASGEHVLGSMRSGAPASTPAFQSGLFYGVSPSVPGYIWFDRKTGREVRMDRAEDAAALEARLACLRPGLLRGGTSYFSILSGGAAVPHFCLSGLAGEIDLQWYGRNLGGWDAIASVLAHTVTAWRGAFRVAHEVGAGVVDGLRWSLAVGRMKHEPRFLAHRVLIGGILRELAVQSLLVDMSRGTPAMYVDFIGYDETAHRRGPDAPAAMRHLSSADAALATLFAAAEAAPELGYDVYVFSDHGHVATRPFESIEGLSLPEFVGMAERGGALPRVERGRPNRGLLGGRTLGGGVADRVATSEAGDLAHVYFLREDGPLPLEGVRARHGRVLAALRSNQAVGILGVRGGRRGLALVRGRILDLADPVDVAQLPHPQPALVATYLADLLSLPESGDLVVLGWRGEGRGVVAYAWEFGSHGGMAPEELDCFVAHPRSCRFRFARVVRPSELYRFFERTYRKPGEAEPEPEDDEPERGTPEPLRAGPELESPPP